LEMAPPSKVPSRPPLNMSLRPDWETAHGMPSKGPLEATPCPLRC
jgi:hypothetical protein